MCAKQLTGFAGGLGGPRRISTGLWKGLGVLRGHCDVLPQVGLKIPHVGWDQVHLTGAGCGGFGRGFNGSVLFSAGLAGFGGHAREIKSWPGKGAGDLGNNGKGAQNNEKGARKLLAAHGPGKASGVVDARFVCRVPRARPHELMADGRMSLVLCKAVRCGIDWSSRCRWLLSTSRCAIMPRNLTGRRRAEMPCEHTEQQRIDERGER